MANYEKTVQRFLLRTSADETKIKGSFVQQKMKQVLKFKDFFVVEIVWIKAIVELRYNQIKTFCYLKD